MAENIPSIPGGAVPPKKETGKVQPKKETVRINLPPKPSAAPTIKLPTLPPGGPAALPGTPSAAAPAAAAPAHRAMAAPVAAAAAAAVGRPAAPAAMPRPVAPAMMAQRTSVLDVVLAVVAFVAGLVAAGSTGHVLWLLLAAMPNS